MKFWFGKKESDHGEQSKVSCDVLTIPDEVKSEEPKPLFVSSKKNIPDHESEKPLAKSDFSMGFSVSDGDKNVSDKNVSGSMGEPKGVEGETKPAQTPSVPVKPVLRPLGESSVRQAVSAGPSISSSKREEKVLGTKEPGPTLVKLNPVQKPQSSAAPTPTPARSFGLRPRMEGGAAASSVQHPVASGKETPSQAGAAEAVEADHSMVRPKPDQRALYYELMNGLYDAILILDDQGHVVDGNTRVTDVLGYTREDTWDLPIDKVIAGMTPQMFAHLRRNLAEHHHVLIDARCSRQDGSSFAAEVGVSTLSLTRGDNMVFAIRNVDRRKRAMEELKKGQNALQIALAPTFVCDLEGHFLTVNQALLESFGIPDVAQARSVRFADLLPDAARFFLRASCGEKLHETLQVGTPNGVSIRIELSLSPIQNGQTITAVAGSLLQM